MWWCGQSRRPGRGIGTWRYLREEGVRFDTTRWAGGHRASGVLAWWLCNGTIYAVVPGGWALRFRGSWGPSTGGFSAMV